MKKRGGKLGKGKPGQPRGASMMQAMKARDVFAVLNLLEGAQLRVWVDGGWGVDALLGRETRQHADLDLALALTDMATARNLLRRVLGYVVARDEMPTRLELCDKDGHHLDLHPLVFDASGNGRQALPGGAWGTYSAEGLRGAGMVAGRRVRCLTPELQLRFHLGYPPDADDAHDVALLCQHFGLDVPEPYRQPRA